VKLSCPSRRFTLLRGWAKKLSALSVHQQTCAAMDDSPVASTIHIVIEFPKIVILFDPTHQLWACLIQPRPSEHFAWEHHSQCGHGGNGSVWHLAPWWCNADVISCGAQGSSSPLGQLFDHGVCIARQTPPPGPTLFPSQPSLLRDYTMEVTFMFFWPNQCWQAAWSGHG
jgi:hypothetical protein